MTTDQMDSHVKHSRAYKALLAVGVALMGAGAAFASAVIEGKTLTFDVAENDSETYDQAIPTDGSVTTIYKKGKGKIILTKAGGKDRAITVYIQEGILEMTVRGAIGAYNNFYISKGAQIYANNFDWPENDYKNYATLVHYFKSVAGDGPDGTGAIRVAAKYAARACIRNELTLSDDATIYSDKDLELGISTGTTLNLNGHTLTFAGKGMTTFNTQQGGSVTVNPGKGGQIVIATTSMPKLQGNVVFSGDATAKMTLSTLTTLYIEDTVTIPWTLESTAEDGTYHAGSFSTGTLMFLGGRTLVGNTVKVGGSSAGGALIVKSGASFIGSRSNLEVGSAATGNTPSLIKVEADAVVSNKSISTYTTGSKLAIQTWGHYTHTDTSYMANWDSYGFFGLEGGDTTLNYGPIILGRAGSHGLFQQDAGTLTFSSAETKMSQGGRSDYLMRGGKIDGKANFRLCIADDAKYVKKDCADDAVSFSMIGEKAEAFFTSGLNLNQRTGGVEVAVNLNAGRFNVKQMTKTSGVPAYINLNGGTFVIPADSTVNRLIENGACTKLLTTIYGNGITFEVNRPDRTFLTSQELNAGPNFPMRGVSGKGIKSVKVPAGMPRSGYRGIMPVIITNAADDTTGRGAFAALDFNVADGTIGEDLLILCPGCDYTAAPKVVAYGPDYTTAYECTVTLTDAAQTPGTFVKTGVGEFVLNTTNNLYAGPYVISNGTLMVNYNAKIPTTSTIHVAGGCFRWDWTNRTISELGGWGTFFGCRDDNAQVLTVNDRFVADANDLIAGRSLCVDENTDDGVRYAKNDSVSFGANCKVAIKNVDKLPPSANTYVLLRQQTAINRVPALETPNDKLRLFKRSRGGYSELCLKRKMGFLIVIQ